MELISAFFRWLGHPFRSVARALMVLVNLSPRQMQSLTTLALIGGIVANSVWTFVYVSWVRTDANAGHLNASFFDMATGVVLRLAITTGLFAVFICLIAFGADWLRVKYRGASGNEAEVETGHGERGD